MDNTIIALISFGRAETRLIEARTVFDAAALELHNAQTQLDRLSIEVRNAARADLKPHLDALTES